jgi:hypothetical protein
MLNRAAARIEDEALAFLHESGRRWLADEHAAVPEKQ